ncbi:MAG: helix-turn-helix domain-containing protein [Solirubrobacterales bacterium]
MTAAEVAERLGISLRTVRRLQGELGGVHIGRSVRFDPERVNAWLAERMAEGDAERNGAT